MITTTVYLDLSRDNRERTRRAIGSLYGIPAGSKVVVFVGGRRFADPEACQLLSDYLLDLHLEITGDPAAIESWSAAIREGRP